jgi:hypothetical protein
MVGPWPYRAFTFRALTKTYGQMWLRCNVCRRYARLYLAEIRDTDYRAKPLVAGGVAPMARWRLPSLIAERVFGRARLKIVGGNHLGRRQRIAYDRTQPRFADTIALLAE